MLILAGIYLYRDSLKKGLQQSEPEAFTLLQPLFPRTDFP